MQTCYKNKKRHFKKKKIIVLLLLHQREKGIVFLSSLCVCVCVCVVQCAMRIKPPPADEV